MRCFVAICSLCLATILFVRPAFADEPTAEKPLPYEPNAHYVDREIEGWKVRVNRSLLEDGELAEKTLTLLRHHLYQIVRVVPEPAVEKLRTVLLWVEKREPHHPCMVYHPDVEWLTEHGMNPEKAHCVELANAENFLTWTHAQPWMVLHELAHAYHHQFLDGGFENADVAEAFRRAMESERYGSVLHINGRREQAYAATNPMEYFAETAEAFFGTNDFFPFVRSELKEHDDGAFQMHERLWRLAAE